MDVAFKYTNFGVVSITHGDYFLKTKGYTAGDILSHVLEPVNKFKNTIVLFPEGIHSLISLFSIIIDNLEDVLTIQ